VSDLWELTSFVEDNPHNGEQRWRLAKKLYAAFEYRLALEHMQVLESDLGDTADANLYRYLGATYYRLQRYDQCLRALTRGLERFPEQPGIWEQQAKALKAMERYRDAAAAWGRVAALDKDNRVAKRAEKALLEMADEKEGGHSSVQANAQDSLIHVLDFSDVDCPDCGAPNNQESQACWRCGISFSEEVIEKHSRFDKLQDTAKNLPWRWFAGAAWLALAGVAIYLSWPEPIPESPHPIPESFWELWLRDFAVAQYVLVGVLVVAWPVAFYYAGLTVTQGLEPSPWDCILFGSLTGLGVYVCTMLPHPWHWALALAFGIGFSGFLSFFSFDMGPAKGLRLWLLQLAMVGIGVVTAVIAGWGLTAPLLPVGLATVSGLAEEDRSWTYEGEFPVQAEVVWTASGSNWLDGQLNSTGIEANTRGDVKQLSIRLFDEDGTPLAYQTTDKEKLYTEGFDFEVGKTYRLEVETDVAVKGKVRIWGMLPMEIKILSADGADVHRDKKSEEKEDLEELDHSEE